MRRLRIEESWNSYSRDVLPQDAPLIQRVECRRAFYAGAQGLLGIIMRMLDPGLEPTEADLKKMDDIDHELRDFMKNVMVGSA